MPIHKVQPIETVGELIECLKKIHDQNRKIKVESVEDGGPLAFHVTMEDEDESTDTPITDLIREQGNGYLEAAEELEESHNKLLEESRRMRDLIHAGIVTELIEVSPELKAKFDLCREKLGKAITKAEKAIDIN